MTTDDRSSAHEEYQNEPNDAGFAGDPSVPTPQREPDTGDHPFGDVDGESIAVPAGDLTGPITDALEGIEADERPGEDS
jgi:hypothetical protein